ncbi:hypothetical protein ACWGB8_28785 [Kitasatospora sp. NPDC054939]
MPQTPPVTSPPALEQLFGGSAGLSPADRHQADRIDGVVAAVAADISADRDAALRFFGNAVGEAQRAGALGQFAAGGAIQLALARFAGRVTDGSVPGRRWDGRSLCEKGSAG